MPTRDAHIAAANRNSQTIRYLMQDGDEHLGWAVTVAFYRALHIVEAVLATGTLQCPQHTDDHKSRNRLLKTDKKFQHLWKMYRPLFEASLIARYLRSNDNGPTYEVFEQYMPRAAVQNMALNHYLHQVENTACTLAGDKNFLAAASELSPPPPGG